METTKHLEQSAPYPAISFVNAKQQIFNVVIIQPKRLSDHSFRLCGRLAIACSLLIIYLQRQPDKLKKIEAQEKHAN